MENTERQSELGEDNFDTIGMSKDVSLDTTGYANNEAKQPRRTLDSLGMSKEYLKAAVSDPSGGGFTFAVDSKLPANKMGYTNMETKVIYINPKLLENPSISDNALKGFLFHEAGHHSEAGVHFQTALRTDLGNLDIVPESIKNQNNPDLTIKFFQALHSHLHNALADIWLESVVSHDKPIVKTYLEELYKPTEGKSKGRDFLKNLPKPDQLLQLLCGEARYGSDKPLDELVDKDVYEAYERITESPKGKGGALGVIQKVLGYFGLMSTTNSRDVQIKQKFNIYRESFLKEWVSLLGSELEKREQSKKNDKGESGKGKEGEGQEGQGQEGEGQEGQGQEGEGQEGQGQEGQTKGQSGKSKSNSSNSQTGQEQGSSSVDAMKELLDELTKAGQERASTTNGEEEDKAEQQSLDEMKKKVKQAAEKQDGDDESIDDTKASEPKPETRQDLADKLARQQRQADLNKQAEKYGADPSLIRLWENIKERYRDDIQSTASKLLDIFVDDRKLKWKHSRKQGLIQPGLERLTAGLLAKGVGEPETKMESRRNKEFLQTELEFIVDVSGSMTGDPLNRSTEMLIVVAEALNRVKNDLADRALLSPKSEQPLKLGVTTFSDYPERLTTLDEPVGVEKEIKIMQGLSQTKGGTEETVAIKEVYEKLTSKNRNILKMIIVLTDGEGNRDELKPILRQIQADNRVVFLAIGLGAGANGVVESYRDEVQSGDQSNIFAEVADDASQILPHVLKFLEQQVRKRARHR